MISVSVLVQSLGEFAIASMWDQFLYTSIIICRLFSYIRICIL
jgi:hypothetical protein